MPLVGEPVRTVMETVAETLRIRSRPPPCWAGDYGLTTWVWRKKVSGTAISDSIDAVDREVTNFRKIWVIIEKEFERTMDRFPLA